MAKDKVNIKNIKDAKAVLRSGNPAKKAEILNQVKQNDNSANPDAKNSDLKSVKVGSSLNPQWLLPTMIGLYLIGIAWVVIFYLTAQIGGYPIPVLRYFNFVVGFGFILGGFALSTRWK